VLGLHGVALAMLYAADSGPGARALLHDQCLREAADPKNPWALAHGITGMGRAFAAGDGRPAAEVIVHDFLEQRDGGYAFQRYAPDQTPIEPHANLLTKTLLLAGYPPSMAFPARWGPVSLKALVASVQSSFAGPPPTADGWPDAAWTLDLLSDSLRPGDHFRNTSGKEIDWDVVMDAALSALEAADGELAKGMDAGLPEVAKDKRGIYAHPCGGMHFVQAVNHWARFPEVRKRWGARWKHQVDVLFYRLGSERRQYDAARLQLPQYRLELATQELKFYGHWLETVGRMVNETGAALTAQQRATVATATQMLEATAQDLQAQGAFASMPELKRKRYQMYLDLIGDACHATHGLDYWSASGGRP
jgi:hypothetical protein